MLFYGELTLNAVQDLMEKTVVLALAIGRQRLSASLCKLVEKYAEILASTGLLSTAMEYLKLVDTENASPELVILRDRIALLSELGSAILSIVGHIYIQLLCDFFPLYIII